MMADAGPSPTVAAVVLTHDEAGHIAECLNSLAWADERIVLDDLSSDGTVEIATQRGARVVHHPMENFAVQRNAALDATDVDWVFFVDADERCTSELAEEVRRVIGYEGAEARDGWWVPRHNIMIGHRMRGGGWYPDYQLRLLRRARARYDPEQAVHEVAVLEGDAGTLQHHLTHYNYDSVRQFRTKMRRYTRHEAEILRARDVRVRPWTYLSMPAREFWRRFVTLRGYRDHVYGLLFCGLMAWYTFETYARLRAR